MRLIWKLLKKFWLPILIITLRLLGRKYPAAKKAHGVITKLR
ncbi:MAG: hypothetical protein RL672_281 [Actinomycetota bacterium]|jgi:hypothetical protein